MPLINCLSVRAAAAFVCVLGAAALARREAPSSWEKRMKTER